MIPGERSPCDINGEKAAQSKGAIIFNKKNVVGAKVQVHRPVFDVKKRREVNAIMISVTLHYIFITVALQHPSHIEYIL